MYQPVVELDTGNVVGLEALARWHHPVRGLIQPCEFIGLAEETGLITVLGRQVMTSALTQIAEWHQKYPRHASTRIAVNLSGDNSAAENSSARSRACWSAPGSTRDGDPRSPRVSCYPAKEVTVDRLRGLAGWGPASISTTSAPGSPRSTRCGRCRCAA